jgi:hypothetical protein
MTSPNRPTTIVALVAAVLALGLILSKSMRPGAPHPASTVTTAPSAATVLNQGEPLLGPSPNVSKGTQPLDDAAKELLSATDGSASRKILVRLKSYLLSLPKSVASRLIAEFLNEKTDAGTKLQFSIARNGLLSGAPTLRIYLLDLLAQIDPAAAGQYAIKILATPDSPDEWAISLRNFARYDTSAAAQGFIQSKIQEMLSNTAWRENPSIGFLEAFDTIVYSHDTGLTPALADLVSDPKNRAVAHAAFLTLDRLIIQDPGAVLSQLQAQPNLMQGHELTRANFFARADIANPDQRSLVESYLLDPNRTPQELNTFAGIFPNENFMLSNNLLTQTETPTGADIAQRDRSAMGVVQTWLSDPRFQSVLPQLQTIQKRLQIFVNEAGSQRSQ